VLKLEFKLYQVKLVLTREFGFIGFVQLESFSMDNYDLLYEGEVQGKDDIDTLDNLFRKFNLNHPEDFVGRSMSASDVLYIL
jgi:hypothetical protein